MRGLIWWGVNNIFQVQTELGPLECRFKGKVLKNAEDEYNPLCPGDIVEIEPDSLNPGHGMIISRQDRRNHFSRWNKKKMAPQVLAANLDFLVIVTCPDAPPFRPRFIDRALLMAAVHRIPPLIVINKSDQGIEEEMAARLKIFNQLKIPLAFTSVIQNDGITELRDFLKGKTSAFVGQSGVGKSSLLNLLHPDARQRVGELSMKYNRGIHTTNYGILLPWPEGGGIIDTPGIRELEIFGIDSRELGFYFPEIAEHSPNCSFQPCSHTHEPGCAVSVALAAGTIHPDRWESYLRLYEEIKQGEVLG